MSKKLRNRLIALICLLAFAALGGLFYVNWVVQRPFAIILFLGDGLTTGMLPAARLYQDGADHRLNLEELPNLALLTTYANDFAVPDAASAASAIATGTKTNNSSLAVDAAGHPLESLLTIASRTGRSIGLVSNASLTDSTAAAFFAKTTDPLNNEEIALQLARDANLDLALGGGEFDFVPESKNGRRKDGRDLLLEMRNQGYDIVRSRTELEDIPIWRAPRVLGLFADGNLDFSDTRESQGRQPALSDMVRRAIQLLQYNPKGYLLVVDAGLIAKASHNNEGERVLREILELDAAVGTALEYAGRKALIIVAGKQSVGGFRMNGYPFKNDRGVSVLGTNTQGMPSITWSTGPGGASTGFNQTATGNRPTEPSAFLAPAAVGVAEDVIAVSSGPGAEALRGFKDNTDIFRLIRGNL